MSKYKRLFIFMLCFSPIFPIIAGCSQDQHGTTDIGINPKSGPNSSTKHDSNEQADKVKKDLISAINKAQNSNEMKAVIEDPNFTLDLTEYSILDDKDSKLTRTRALFSMIYEKPIGGYTSVESIQTQLDSIIARLTTIGPDEDLPVPAAGTTLKAEPDFFPIGVWLQAPSNARKYKEIGINTYVGLWNGLNQDALDEFKNADLKVMCDLNKFAMEYIKSNPDDSTIIAWTQSDEPDNAQNTGSSWGPPIDPGSVIVRYNQIKAIDPTRPVYLNLGQGVSWDYYGRGIDTGKNFMYPQYIKGADIVCFDVYPANAEEKDVHNKLWLVPEGIENLRAWSDDEKQTWAWIETGSINGVYRPAPEQIKAQVWMAIIHGAKGIGYFIHEFTPTFYEAGLLVNPENEANKEMVAFVNKQITELAPVLNSPTILNGEITVESDDKKIPIDIMIKEYNGEKYIFSVGMREGSATATFKVPSGFEAQVLGEDRSITIENGQFSDVFSSFDVHIYKIVK